MGQLILATDSVNESEPCISLKENVEASPLGGYHRIQIIRVLRDWKIVEFRKDLGKAEDFHSPPFIIPGAGDDNIPVERVGDLIEIANFIRQEKPRHPEKRCQDLLQYYYYIKEAQRKQKNK